eukprot:CAMPEP_0176223040 /NCGR_PEP_ID=MMETSP0121_2-20121125/20541_1 /TAXON_ID=160619 /ORGANISM="Kryptoperidinium foliaceum, Strain CCMP 1326" /LENGTH=202 /DNA_ID=CAMNT_0017562265 /DNA_START=355 /DNA_END=960 /DNA_ORIENTATION=-
MTDRDSEASRVDAQALASVLVDVGEGGHDGRHVAAARRGPRRLGPLRPSVAAGVLNEHVGVLAPPPLRVAHPNLEAARRPRARRKVVEHFTTACQVDISIVAAPVLSVPPFFNSMPKTKSCSPACCSIASMHASLQRRTGMFSTSTTNDPAALRPPVGAGAKGGAPARPPAGLVGQDRGPRLVVALGVAPTPPPAAAGPPCR